MKNTLDNTIGAALLGVVAASILFGITVVQVYMYYHSYPKDWKFQKIAVALLLLLDILHAIFTILTIYHYLIDSFGDLRALQYLSWAFKLQVAFNVIIVLVVQGLYALRVWRLGHNFSKIWPGLIILLVAGGWGVGIDLTIRTYQTTTFAAAHELEVVLNATFIVATVIDFAIAVAICYYLRSSRTSFSGTNNKIVKVIRYVFICGFLTSACSLSALITYSTMPLNFIFIGIDFLLPHLYINSYLALLNARNVSKDRDSSFDVTNAFKFQTGMTQQSESTDREDKSDQTNSIAFSPSRYQDSPFPIDKINNGHVADHEPTGV